MYKASSSESGHGDGEKGELENSGTSEDMVESSNESDEITENSSDKVKVEDETTEDMAFLEDDLEEEPVEDII
jgi:hypothetical protein